MRDLQRSRTPARTLPEALKQQAHEAAAKGREALAAKARRDLDRECDEVDALCDPDAYARKHPT